MSFIQV